MVECRGIVGAPIIRYDLVNALTRRVRATGVEPTD